MHPVILFLELGLIISKTAGSFSISFYNFTSFRVFYLNLLSIYLRVPPFEVSVGFHSIGKTVLFGFSLNSLARSWIWYVRKIFWKTNVSYSPDACAYQEGGKGGGVWGLRNVGFSESFTNVLNDWSSLILKTF